MSVDKPTPGNLIATVSELVDSVNGGSGIVPVPAADVGYTLDTTTYNNIVKGSGKMAVAVFPADTTVVAIALEGDAFPRLLINADPGDFGSICFGDGTSDPTTGYIGLFSGKLTVGSPDGNSIDIGNNLIHLIAPDVRVQSKISASSGLSIESISGGIDIVADAAGSSVSFEADSGNRQVALDISGISINSDSIGFFGQSPISRPTGVPVTAAGIHAALVALGLITA